MFSPAISCFSQRLCPPFDREGHTNAATRSHKMVLESILFLLFLKILILAGTVRKNTDSHLNGTCILNDYNVVDQL